MVSGDGISHIEVFQYLYILLLCTLPGRRPGIAEGDERTRLGRVHLYFFLLF